MSTAWMRTPGRSSSSSPPCFPYGAKLLINGHHYAQAQAAKAGIAFTALDNGFAACDDPAAVQAICDALTEDTIEALARKWPAVLPNPYSAADQAAGYRYKISKIKQYHKLGKALRTETTINGTRDFGIGKRLANLPALRQTGFTANRRLLGAQTLSHDPIAGAAAPAQVTSPVITPAGTRVAGLRLTDPRSLALLHVLCVFRLLPHGFTNAVLRRHLAPLLGTTPDLMTSGQITYDLRRLRPHGLIERIPHTFRYQVTDTGIRSAQNLTRVHDRLLRAGLAEITDTSPPAPTALRAADRAYQAAIDDLTRQAGLAA